MEVFLYNSTVCRLCGEENDNGTLLYTCDENIQSLSEVINTYLPIKVADDGQLPRTICPGCTIQLEATVEFLNLIVNGQKVLRELHQREKEYKKTVFSQVTEEAVTTDNIIVEVDTNGEIYQVDHPIALQVAGLERPKRKRGRPPKKSKSPEELAQEAALRDEQQKSKEKTENDELTGKRRRKTPTRFMGVVQGKSYSDIWYLHQGKELEKIFKEEGMTDDEGSDSCEKTEEDTTPRPTVLKQAEVIGHKEDSGELVVVVKGKGRGRPKGRMRPTREECGICGMEFSCIGRYMSHVAQHGPVSYCCLQCEDTFPTRLLFNLHQAELSHTGQKIISVVNGEPIATNIKDEVVSTNKNQTLEQTPNVEGSDKPDNIVVEPSGSLPDLNSEPLECIPEDNPEENQTKDPLECTPPPDDTNSSPITEENNPQSEVPESSVEIPNEAENEPLPKRKLKCNYCDKLFSSKQSKSLHTKATHYGERPYVCLECGASFGYPRSLALHKLSHRRSRTPAHGYACDLCGKVLNHPSSVVYHKEAEHAGQRYVCNKCGKSFKHKQLLARHQLVHTQLRPYNCKLCGSTFKTKPSLLNHQLLHSGIKKYTCEICNEKFAHKTSHTLHMRWHTGVKPYACKICGKSFSQKGNLSEHERIHTGEKPYQCSLCPRRFTTSSQHRLHARRHLADRPHAPDPTPKRRASRIVCGNGVIEYRCGECGRSFPERWLYTKHMRRHTGERPYRCPHCPRAFADCSNLNKHKKQVHKQVSLLVSEKQQPESGCSWTGSTFTLHPQTEKVTLVEAEEGGRLIYVACETSSAPSVPSTPSTGFRILQSQQELEELQAEPERKPIAAMGTQDMPSVIVNANNQIPVTDEQGNPLHFTMQDGTRLAITSSDGKTLQVITQDGQTIPVEINGYAEEEEVHNPDTIVHQLDLHKSVDTNVASPVTHFFAIV